MSFREGQVIKVYGEKDDDGFFKVRVIILFQTLKCLFLQGAIKGGKRGLVPCNMIAQVDVPDGATLEALYARGFLNSDNSLNVPKNHENHENLRRKTTNGLEKNKKRFLIIPSRHWRYRKYDLYNHYWF